MDTSMTVNGKEVQNPARKIRLLLGIFLILAICVATLISLVGFTEFPFMLGVLLLCGAFTVPMHFLLRLFGRRGFYIREGHIHKWTTSGAFEQR